MTGSEAFHLVAPLLWRLALKENGSSDDTFEDLFVTMFIALKEYDQNRGRKFEIVKGEAE